MRRQLRITNDLVRRYCAHQRASGSTQWRIPERGTTFVLALRNGSPVPGQPDAVLVHDSRPNEYDDAIGLGGAVLALFPGTTDPGRPHTLKPMNRRGALYMVPGTYWYKIGHHKVLWNWALVEDEDIVIRRDRDRDGRIQESDGPRERGRFGAHVHVGGLLARLVGLWSAGCLVIPKQYWAAFKRLILAARRERILVVMIDAKLLAKWVEEQ
jgi:hypothetical protein